jgi:UDP-2,4-diacetamido-2,4,6-trideoxy-beta-L-altropyranose hydrolase
MAPAGRPLAAFRTDASVGIGTGHVMRCLTLADRLARTGFETLFLVADQTAAWRQAIEARGHGCVVLPPPTSPDRLDTDVAHGAWLPGGMVDDAAVVVDALRQPADWLIVDHYALDARWERRVRQRARRILAVDDLANRPHDCDILLDQGLQTRPTRYAALLPAGARALLGPRHALLRPEFAAARGRIARDDRRVIVFMGGGDGTGATLMAIDALSQPDLANLALDVVVGAANPHRDAIASAIARRGHATLHVDAVDMAGLCARAWLGVGAGGGAALERCCLGLPTVTVCLAANQAPGVAALAKAGAVLAAGATAQGIAAGVRALLRDGRRHAAMAQAALAVTDGLGATRVTAVMAAATFGVTVREATRSDAGLLFEWRNHEDVRAASFSSEPLDFDDHCAWLEAALADPATRVLVGEAGRMPVGTVRFHTRADAATVSIALDPTLRGLGLAVPLLRAGEAALATSTLEGTPTTLHAHVLPANIASRRLFETCGYGEVSTDPLRLLYTKPIVAL